MKLDTRTLTPRTFDNPFTPYYKLILFYLIPKKYLVKWNLESFPRNPHVFIQSYKWKSVYKKQRFNSCIEKVWATHIWRYLDISAPFKSFSSNDPIVVWIRNPASHAWILDSILQLSSRNFVDSPNEDIPFPSDDTIDVAAKMVAKYLRSLTKFDEIIEIVHNHRDFADFNPFYRTDYQRDFHRKYYRTRNKYSRLTSLEQEQNRKTGNIRGEPVNTSLETQAWIHDFFNSLGDIDRKIAVWLYDGYTQEEIAQALGYKNNSAVSKRLKGIRQKLREYMD